MLCRSNAGLRRLIRFSSSVGSPAAATNQNVTLPFIRELFQSDYLNTLLPTKPRVLTPNVNATNTPHNPTMDTLKHTTDCTRTDNGSPEFTSSTLSPVLDLFRGLNPVAKTVDIYKRLDEAWLEDPELTMRIIWNIRSLIHDGKSDRGVFYASVEPHFSV